jgi:tetratricopeptide (TPR) repeat protein
LDPTRIADLRRRLQADPTSIAFAQLAEEYRRARQFDQAVAVCREGLQRHTGYLSARITLGRALAELGQTAEAEEEFEYVLRSAPDNLAAIRGLAEIHQKHGNLQRALTYYRRALTLAHYDPDLDETVRAIADELGSSETVSDGGLSFEQARQELMAAPSRVPAVAPAKTERVDFDKVLQSLGYAPDAPAPPIVEAWLAGPSAPGPEVASTETPLAAEAVVGDDLLAQLEQELRQLAGHPSSVDVTSKEQREQLVIAELERWLSGIAVRRRVVGREAGTAPSTKFAALWKTPERA